MNKSIRKFNFGDGQTMNHVFRQFSMAAITIAITQVASAQVSITNVVPLQIPGQGTEIRVIFNGLPPQPQAYQLESPSRLILDFDQVQQNVKQTTVNVATAEASAVDLSSDAQRARLTVNLADAGAFTTRVEGNTFILKINSAKANAVAPSVAQQPVSGVSNIGFQRGAKGEGQVVIDLAGSNTPVDVQQQGTKIVVRTLGSKLPTHLTRRLNVNDYATPISTIDAVNQNGSGVITVQSAGSFEYMAYQTDNKLTISLKRPEEKNPLKPKAVSYSGKKISLDFQDIEVRRVLQLLADFTDINMVAADSVQGNITLRLKEVPWDQALDIVLKTKNLDKRRNGNVIWIAPVAELIKAEEEQAKALAQSVKLSPIQTEYMQLSYAKVEDIEKLITQNKSAQNSGGSSSTSSSGSDDKESLLSSRGSVSIDKRTNTLIVNDTQQFVEKIRNLVDLLDVAVKQVMVEARIVTAERTFSRDLGIKWGLQRNNPTFTGGANGSNVWGGDFSPRVDLGVDLGTPSAGTFNFGLLKISDYMLDLQLTALQSDGLGEVLSAPKILTADKQKAYILRGVEIPYQSYSANEGTTTEFKEANLKLEVTPSITPEGKVQLELKVEKDAIGEMTTDGPSINTNELQTNVLVNDGETVVLGGIFDDFKSTVSDKVPFLGDLPVVGNLFKNNSKISNQAELLIFVTPRIVNDTVSRNH